MLGYINLGRHLVFERFKSAFSLFGPDTLSFVVMIQASNFGADAYHSIKHRGFRVLSTPQRQSVIVENVSAFSTQLLPETTRLELAPGGSHQGAPISRGAHLSKKRGARKRVSVQNRRKCGEKVHVGYDQDAENLSRKLDRRTSTLPT